MPHAPDRLDRQLAFIAEIDRLKSVERRTSIIGGGRLENSAEHSWHLAVMVSLLTEYAPAGVDGARAQAMLLVHDVVEIDAGDAFAFDPAAQAGQAARERVAADRLFGLLPDDQRGWIRALWDEFEAGDTPTARFAVALDRFQGLLMNRGNAGGTWIQHGVGRERILERMAPIREGAPALWDVVLRTLEEVGLGEG